jgi:hypothetical protein
MGGNEYDAQDLDETVSYINNIEPTLARNRPCFFEWKNAYNLPSDWSPNYDS